MNAMPTPDSADAGSTAHPTAMDETLPPGVRNCGPVFALLASQPLLLAGSCNCWLLLQGAVDLFCVALEQGRPAGARRHLCRLCAPQRLFGLDLDGDGAGLPARAGLLAVGLPGTICIAQVFDSRHAAQLTPDWRRQMALVLPALDDDGLTLPAFHRVLLAVLEQRLASRAQQESLHAAQRNEHDRRILRGAMSALAGVLTPARSGLAAPLVTGDALTDAVATVLRAEGLQCRLRPPPLAPPADVPAVHDSHAMEPKVAADAPVGLANDVSAQLARRVDLLCAQARVLHREVSLPGADSGGGIVGQDGGVSAEGGNGEAWWQTGGTALLAFRRSDLAPVALLPAQHGYEWIDPDSGQRARLGAVEAAALADRALMFYRSFPVQEIGLSTLIGFGLAGSTGERWRLLAYGLAGGLLGLAPPALTGLLYDAVLPASDPLQLMFLALVLLAVSCGIVLFKFCRSLVLLRLEARMGSSTHAAIVERLLHLPARFFRNYPAADLAQRAFGVENALLMLTTASESAAFGWMFALISAVYLFFIHPGLAVLACLLVLLSLLMTIFINGLRLRLERSCQQLQGSLDARVFQILAGIAKLRAAAAESRAFSAWAILATQKRLLQARARWLGNILVALDAGYVVLCALLLYAFTAMLAPDIAPGAFLAFAAAFAQFLTATVGLSNALSAGFVALAHYERARPILAALPEVDMPRESPGRLAGAIEISQLSFRYGAGAAGSPWILDSVSCRIEAGQFIAIVGASGSGKSTLLRLLLGFEQPQSGSIHLDGRDLSSLDPIAVRRQFGVVMQNGKLLPGNLFSNIAGSASLTLEQAWQAARQAGLEDTIRALPMGMHTVVTDGSNLSGGERQRLMIARALAARPAILLLDEATSALDNASQAIVTDNLARLQATRIVVAHRLSTVLHADRILVFDGGHLVESGTYAELIERDGKLAELARRQHLDAV